jgi:15-cis-phytoene synthase
MITLYAFCREVDDIADEEGRDNEEKARLLQEWTMLVRGDTTSDELFPTEVSDLVQRYPMIREHLLAVIDGMIVDLNPPAYQTWDDLRGYCYLVASSVGLASIEIFGYRHAETKLYAEKLGYALQLTNILRDLEEDLRNNRIYLPREDMKQFHYRPSQLRARDYNDAFLSLMDFEFNRVVQLHTEAIGHLHEEDRPTMLSAELMGRLYEEILDKMKMDRWRVFDKRYRLSKARMVLILAGHVVRAGLHLY